jgi:hypothetical protein
MLIAVSPARGDTWKSFGSDITRVIHEAEKCQISRDQFTFRLVAAMLNGTLRHELWIDFADELDEATYIIAASEQGLNPLDPDFSTL